jgi:D-alanyl-D-alanine carboxypeptidase
MTRSSFRPLGLTHTRLVGHAPRGSTFPPAEVFDGELNITKTRSNGAYWADGGIISTAGEMIHFLRSLNKGEIISQQSLTLMHDWHKLQFPLQYGYGTMYFALPRPIGFLAGIPPLWGHSGSTGSFLYYSPDLDLYIAGTLDQTEGKAKPFVLMRKVVAALASDRTREPTPKSLGERSEPQ